MAKNIEWRELKLQYKDIYKKLNVKESRLSNLISQVTFILLSCVISLLCALIASIAIAQNEYIYVYSGMFCVITVITVIFIFIYERHNLKSLVNVIWEKIVSKPLTNDLLNRRLCFLIFNLSIKRYWFTWLVTLLVWLLILICVFVLQYYLHHYNFSYMTN